jgi:hypothetical protein
MILNRLRGRQVAGAIERAMSSMGLAVAAETARDGAVLPYEQAIAEVTCWLQHTS